MLCIWWNQLGVVYYQLLQPYESITGARYRTQLMRLSHVLKEKRPQYVERHNKVILQHGNARPQVAQPVKTYWETLKWEILPHPPYRPDIVPSDHHLFRSAWLSSTSLHTTNAKIGLIRGSPQKTSPFFAGERKNYIFFKGE